jgi:CDP-paratose 2-epimerase
MAWQKRDKVAGQVYNIGGGPQNQFSIKQLVHWIEVESGAPVEIGYAAPRRGDQKVFVADIRKAFKNFGWRPACSAEQGIRKLHRWVNANLELFREILAMPPVQENACAVESTPLEFVWASAGSPVPAKSKRTTG